MRANQIDCLICVFLLHVLVSQACGMEDIGRIDFNRDIRPILADNCFTCHGPDAQQRVNDLQRVIAKHTWQGFATGLVDFFQQISAGPAVLTSALGGTAADTAALASILSSRTWRATASLRKAGSKLRRK